ESNVCTASTGKTRIGKILSGIVVGGFTGIIASDFTGLLISDAIGTGCTAQRDGLLISD
ncbi:MAG: hypothetical protein HOP17_00080, partial [Acidobacteria bacterium]|nr:hypothetical protein [Acidobacteriota bacterium]